MILKDLNSISADAYFIRTTDTKAYVHPESEDKDNRYYKIKEGCVGAAIFHHKQAQNWITASGANNLEAVKVTDVIPDDGSKN